MELRDDYSGPFDPNARLADFSRQALAHLGREYLLNGHLQDRVGLPLVARTGRGAGFRFEQRRTLRGGSRGQARIR
jgi:hypothetical protein